MKIGFIGYGNLGSSIVKRLSSQNVEVLVYNRTKSKVKDVKAIDYPHELTKETDVIFVNVFDSLASKEVIFGENGLIKGNVKDKIIIDMTTNHYAYVKEAYQKLKGLGAYYLDAPVLGSVIPALKGELVMLVGGDRKVFENIEDILKLFTKERIYLGDVPSGTFGKLINNIVLGAITDAIAQAIGIGNSIGLGKEDIVKVLEMGAGNSYILNIKKQKFLQEDFSPQFSVKAIYKDLHYAQDMLKDFGLFSFSLSSVKETYGLAIKNNLGELDFSVIYKLYKND